MSSVSGSIGRIIASARSLRKIADELDNVELKSQIIDEISTLQEIRDELSEEGGSHDVAASELAAVVKSAGSSDDSTAAAGTADETAGGETPQNDAPPADMKIDEGKFAYIEPGADGETYGINAEPEEEEPADESSDSEEAADPDSESDGDSDPARDEDAEAKPKSDEKKKKSAKAKPKLTPEQRAVVEMKIADLEPLERDAQRRLDSVLTPEQKQIKVQATRAARDAGKSGRDLQIYIHKAMKTSPEQRHQLSEARKDLARVREAIEKERAVLDEEE